MPTQRENLKDHLSRYLQITLNVIGRKSGKTITNPVWFVAEGEKLYLLPVHGSDTQWYRNVLENPQIRVDARDSEVKLEAKPITTSDAVKCVVEKFGDKYGASDVKRYYSKFDVAVVAELVET
jgi:deazaflavin-dependent oxidoreductase (nitroreductase family)